MLRMLNPHRDLAAAMHRLIQARYDDQVAGLDVAGADQVVITARGVRKRDWIDEAMTRSIRRFEYPLDTAAKRRLTASTLRHRDTA